MKGVGVHVDLEEELDDFDVIGVVRVEVGVVGLRSRETGISVGFVYVGVELVELVELVGVVVVEGVWKGSSVMGPI